MRFAEFLRATVLLCAAAASALAAVTLASTAAGASIAVLEVSGAWWVLAALAGLWIGRRGQASAQIASLLARARSQTTLPAVNPARTLLNRLWPLLLCTVGAGALGAALPQVPGVAAGFAIIWALAWRRQAAAVSAIERRDGARFYVADTSPVRPIELLRTPGFRAELRDLDGAGRRRARPRA
ncbi:MAG TPA: hypothetical protein VKV27_05065 [Solirubrobacteraceae bacterium]|nr:hypothetical protein [Solirubrobacteraceae bacterium]